MQSVDYWRRSTDVTIRRGKCGLGDGGIATSGMAKSEATQLSYRFFGLVKAAHRAASAYRSRLSGDCDTAAVRELSRFLPFRDQVLAFPHDTAQVRIAHGPT
jgi:hypothetical protein